MLIGQYCSLFCHSNTVNYLIIRAKRTKRNGAITILVLWLGTILVLSVTIKVVLNSEQRTQSSDTCEERFLVSFHTTNKFLPTLFSTTGEVLLVPLLADF